MSSKNLVPDLSTRNRSLPKVLPNPDRFGNYWLLDKPRGPVIFKADSKDKLGKFFASRGCDIIGVGLLTDENGITYFDTAEEALIALKVAK